MKHIAQSFESYRKQFLSSIQEYIASSTINPINSDQLRTIILLVDVLESYDNISKWLESDLKAFAYKSGLELIYDGRSQEVEDELIRLRDGVFI